MSVEIRIVCDVCKQVDPHYGWGEPSRGATATKLRKALRNKRGWKTKINGGEDLCYSCIEATKAQE